MTRTRDGDLHVEGLRVEQEAPGAPLGTARPRLSWRLAGHAGELAAPTVCQVEWSSDTGIETVTVEGADATLRPWPLADLRSGQSGSVRVRAGDGRLWTDWSHAVPVLVGLLDPGDWTASFISPRHLGGLDTNAPTLVRDFDLDAQPTSARAWVTALGVYELRINGVVVGGDVLAPGWTAYEHHLRYQSYDVASYFRAGRNRIEATLGNGWYRGYLTWEMNRANYGDRLALLAQVDMSLPGGTLRVGTDLSWWAVPSVIVSDDLYNGEHHALPARSDAGRDAVDIVSFDKRRLIARRGPAVRVTGTVGAQRIFPSPSGALLVDFGQNLVGRVRIMVHNGEAGHEVVVKHAEVLEHGELALRPLGHAKATCRYVLDGESVQVLAPTFTFSGFRYAQVEGLEQLETEHVVAEVIGTDLTRTGWFSSSDPALNQLHSNIVWGARGNFLDIPTDCPQRAERLGWTGDIQVFAPTANFLFDTSGFLAGWLEDLAAEQLDDGSVPWIVPNVYPGEWVPAAGWGDAATIVPLALHDSFADDGMLRRQFPSMCAWVDKVASLADDRGVWFATGQIGDWLDPDAPPEDPAAAKADPAVVATAYLYRSALAVAEAASRLGLPESAHRYSELARRVASGFAREFVSADGVVRSDCQTVYALALGFGLLSDHRQRAGASARLAELVELADATVSTGFLGTPHILDALCIAGRPDLAHRMLRQTKAPSWLYAVEMGATTMWERWDALLPDGSVNSGSMTSFNHYAYGAVADFLHRRVAGLRPLEPGYRRFAVEPLPGQLDSAEVTLDAVAGRIEVSWMRVADTIEVRVTVPYAAEAVILLPGETVPVVRGAGTHVLGGRLAS